MPQKVYLSTDPQAGKEPAATPVAPSTGATTQQAPRTDAAKPSMASTVLDVLGTMSTPLTPEPVRKFFNNLTIGAAKGTASRAVDVARHVQNPAADVTQAFSPLDVAANSDALQSQNTAQTIGSYAPDVAMAVLTGMASKNAAEGIRKTATGAWRAATNRPLAEPESVSEDFLAKNIGRMSHGDAAARAELMAGKAPFMKARAAAFGTEQTAYNQARPNVRYGLTQYLLNPPSLKANAAQQLYNAAPAAPYAAGGGMLAADFLARLLAGGGEQK